MSDASSEVAQHRKQPVSGWLAGIAALFATASIYLLVPAVVATAIVVYQHSLQGHTIKEINSMLTETTIGQFVYIALVEVLMVAGVFMALRIFRWRRSDIGLKKPTWFHPLVGLAAVVPYFVLYIAMARLVTLAVPGFDIDQKQEIGFESVQGALELTLTFIGLVILAPVAEEILMRGFLYTGLKKWLPRIAAALAVSILFGAAHLNEGGAAGPLWIGALDTCILSLVLIWLREKTGNLWAGITLHMAKNLIAFLALFVFAIR